MDELKMIENELKSKIYNKYYYRLAQSASLECHKNPGLESFKIIANNKEAVLECGCGEGTKLSEITTKSKNAYGIDFSSKAIKMAKMNYPIINFKQGDIEKLPYKNECFDFVYTAFVLEHTDNPELALKEMIRVTKIGGYIGLICPNFGSFCYRSPCSNEILIKRSIYILLRDIFMPFFGKNTLHWQKVKPIATAQNYKSDWDTTIEPSLITTLHFLSNFENLRIIKKSSIWELFTATQPKVKYGKFVIKSINYICFVLGRSKIFPFKYWGPQLFIVLEKKQFENDYHI